MDVFGFLGVLMLVAMVSVYKFKRGILVGKILTRITIIYWTHDRIITPDNISHFDTSDYECLSVYILGTNVWNII